MTYTVDEARHLAESIRRCKACGVSLLFVRMASGKIAPLCEDPENPGQTVNHFTTCPDARRFTRKPGKTSDAVG